MDGPTVNGWTYRQNKLFENALAIYNIGKIDDETEKWERVSRACGKTVEEVKVHFQKLVDDLELIESGQISPPDYDKAAERSRAKVEVSKYKLQ